MQHPLPSITKQRRLTFRPELKDVILTYDLLNQTLFDNELSRPDIRLRAPHGAWGICRGEWRNDETPYVKSIDISDKYFTKSWFVTILSHEMVHQWQWEVDGPRRLAAGKDPLMNHGPNFFQHRERFAEHGISLKMWHRSKKWFKYQDFFKC